MRIATAALLVAAAACYVGPPRYYEPPPPAPRPAPAPPQARRMLTEEEAVGVATSFARSQGLSISHVKHAHLDGAGRWHIDLRGDRGHDKAKVLVDAWTGQVLRSKLKDEDRDWDD